MPPSAAKAQLREQQKTAITDLLTRRPGMTAFLVSLHVPVHQPGNGVLLPAVGHIGTQAAPLTLTLDLLAELEKTGRVHKVDDPQGNRWYLTGEEGTRSTEAGAVGAALCSPDHPAFAAQTGVWADGTVAYANAAPDLEPGEEPSDA